MLSFLVAMLAALIASALLHSTDPEVGGVGGLSSPSAVVSVCVYAIPVMAMVLAGLWTCREYGHSASRAVTGVLALCAGALVTRSGSGAMTGVGMAWTLTGSTMVIWAMLVATVSISTLVEGRAEVDV